MQAPAQKSSDDPTAALLQPGPAARPIGGEEGMNVDEMLTRYAGEFGPWQVRQFLLTSLAWILCAFQVMTAVFADREPAGPVPCPVGIRSGRAWWLARSTVEEWGLTCGEKYKVGLAQSAFFAGSMAGADSFLGRKGVLTLTTFHFFSLGSISLSFTSLLLPSSSSSSPSPSSPFPTGPFSYPTRPDPARPASIVDVMRSHVTRPRLILGLLINFLISVSYYGLTLNAANLGPEIHVSVVVNAVAEMPAYALTAVALRWHVTSMWMCGFFCFAAAAFGNAARMGCAAAATYNLMYVCAAEMFPTEVRNELNFVVFVMMWF